jgi:ribosome-associated heat shock protein Hsp15
MSGAEDRDWQRLDKWLWCARFMRQRADCARLAAGGLLRINRLPTDKPHARLRVGDVVTLALPGRGGGPGGGPGGGQVRVVEVLALAARRGPATEAALLYREIPAASDQSPC